VPVKSKAEATLCRLRTDRRVELFYALILSRLGLVLGVTALMLSLGSIRFGRRGASSREVVSTLSLIGLGLVLFGLIFAVASSRF
jgi:hypothetical protein